jgi:hypothetical protein
MEEILKLIVCPCCYEIPRPGLNNEIGLCNNGHLVCIACFVKLQCSKKECPVCRSVDINVSTSHYLVNGLLSIISAITVYTCKYEHCSQAIEGSQAIKEHEQHCEMKLLKCPQMHCKAAKSFQSFINGEHSCLISEPCQDILADQKQWHFTINLEDFFSVDSFKARIQSTFQPRLLINSDCSHHRRLFINATNFSMQSIIIYTGWLNTSDDSPKELKELKSHLHVYIATKAGSVGYAVMGRIFCQDETTIRCSEGIYLNYVTLSKWLQWTNDFKCTFCNHHSHAHLHVKVTL